MHPRGRGAIWDEFGIVHGVTKFQFRRMRWKAQPKRVIALYPKSWSLQSRPRVRRDTWNPVGIWVDHHLRLNTHYEPIVHKYREGKVKRTLKKGVK